MGEYLISLRRKILATDDLQDERCLIVGLEGMPVGAELIQKTSQGPDIALFIIGLLLTELRREIEGSADHGLGKVITSKHLGYSQISNLHSSIAIHEDIKRLDVTMQNPILVDVL